MLLIVGKNINYLFHICLKKKKCQVDDSSLNINVHNSTSPQNDTCCDVIYQNTKHIDQFQPNFIQHREHSNCSTKEISALNSKVAVDCLPLITHISAPIDSSNILPSPIIYQKPNPVPREIYDYMRESSDLSSDHSSITSGEFFEEDRESEN